MTGRKEARDREVKGQQEAKDREKAGHQEFKDLEMKGQQEARDREPTGMKEGRKGTDLKEGAALEEGLNEFPIEGAKDRGRGPHLEIGHKAGAISAEIVKIIPVNAEELAAVGLVEIAETGHRDHKVIALKDQEIMKADRKKLYFKRAGAHQKVSF